MLKWFRKQPVTIRAAIIGALIAGAFVLISSLIPYYCNSPSTENARSDNSDDGDTNNAIRDNNPEFCATVESSLKSWIDGFDLRFLKSYDSLRSRLADKVGLESGLAVSTQLDFCIDKRIEKNTKIDSFIIELARHNCDTNALNIRRKLPINVRNITKRRTMDYGPHYKGVILDTL